MPTSHWLHAVRCHIHFGGYAKVLGTDFRVRVAYRISRHGHTLKVLCAELKSLSQALKTPLGYGNQLPEATAENIKRLSWRPWFL